MTHSQTITLYQPMLLRIAENILGSIQDAEDIVHDTYLKWLSTDIVHVKNIKGYLIKSVTNNCLNHLEAIKRKKNELLEDWHLSSFVEKQKEREIFKFDIENELSIAVDLLHKKLQPIEKSVYVLREILDFDYDDIQQIVNKKATNCRKLFSRAKEKLKEETSHLKIHNPHTSFLKKLKKAAILGEIGEFVDELKRDLNHKIPFHP